MNCSKLNRIPCNLTKHSTYLTKQLRTPMNTKTIIILSLLLFITLKNYSQKVFSTEYSNQSDIKVYVVDYENQSDLKVFKVDYPNQVDGNKGLWYFVDYKNQSDKKIYFVEYSNQSDLKIFFVTYKNQSGWRDKSKQHLLY